MGLHLAPSFLFTLFLAIALSNVVLADDININPPVIYDARSLIINGSRQLLFSGSIHYPRTQPEMWPGLIEKAKAGGLNVIQTYVFWNVHEPVEGQFNFAGNADLVRFIKCIHEHGLWVNLRVGPYIAAEWNHGGFPYWLREVANITFRSYNEPFMYHMRRYSEMIINMMKNEKLFFPQGGPIIMAQIENEYGAVQATYREDGAKYIQWAAEMAVGLYRDIPWVMCKQPNAPSLVIETCNGRHCADTFKGPNGPDKPTLWTENWTAQYRAFGDPSSQRSAEDLAFSVANFFAKNGTFVNYYMYYGGTNYGRTSSSFVTTRYYDEAPLDEYGLLREPKWGHLRDVHRALRLSKKALFWGQMSSKRIGKYVEIVTYEKPGDASMCAAFLINNHTKLPKTINFRGLSYYVPSKSISILPDCKTVVFNSQTIIAQHSSRNFVPSRKASNFKWESYRETIPTYNDLPIKDTIPRELYQLTKDASDYAWYSTSFLIDRRDLPMRPDIIPVLEVQNNGHAMVAFVNGEFIGFAHGTLDQKKFSLQRPVNLRPGLNHITLLGMTIGIQNSGAHMEKRWAGPDAVLIKGLNTGTLDLTETNWGHEVGISGEKIPLFLEEGSRKVQWSQDTGLGNSVTWYKTHFKAPEGNNPVAITMDSMNKGMIWVNGNSIGRYWSSFLTPRGRPSQTEYHIPREFLKPKNNLLVVFEEVGGTPENITIMTVNRDTICSVISEVTPPSVKTWERKENELRKVLLVEDMKTGARLTCPDDKVIVDVEFASFGDPIGACGVFSLGTCHSPNSMSVVLERCLGKHSCTIPLAREAFYLAGNIDTCPEIFKSLAVQVRCGKSSMP
ncbi:Beta-galactosidase [Heracleum sosnowskyi]|uniref:Beta-galactosidase n=1 Tax=Heracleum sosnowskyi TaxID=360622 RepID=A0AAD8J349_9APIA|nr:Beta-galactosidase [Heracleum sosnowskyi]